MGGADGEHVITGLRAAVAEFADDDGQARLVVLRPHVGDEVHEVVLVLLAGFVVIHVVPALEPNEAGNLHRPTGECGKFRVEVVQCLLHFGQHFGVVLTGFAAGAGRAEIFVQTFAAPRGLDE